MEKTSTFRAFPLRHGAGWRGVWVLGLLVLPLTARGQVIVLSDIVGDGNGSGNAVPGVVGIDADTGGFMTAHNHMDVINTGDLFQAVDQNPAINSVFIIGQPQTQINTDGVTFTFGPGDPSSPARTWNWILKDATHDFDKGFADIWAGGIDSFANGIGIHSSAGITFDLDELRAVHGAANVKFLSCFAGHDQCGFPGAPVSMHAVLSDAKGIIDSISRPVVNGNQGAALELAIPDDALYLTLATGASNGGDIGCDHGVFAEAVVASQPIKSPIRAATTPGNLSACPPDGGGPVNVNITREGSGTSAITVTERAFGPFGQGQVTAQNGGVVSTLVPTGADAETEKGFISAWLLLGPYSIGSTPASNPGDVEMRRDYLTDGGAIEEIDVEPENGDTVNTDYNGLAASTGLAVVTGINPGAVATWTQYIDTDDSLNFDDYYGGNVDNIMMYAVTYLHVGGDVDVDFCVSSDDAIQLLLDGSEIHLNSVARGVGGSESCVDNAVNFPGLTQTLSAGVHKLMAKVFEGGGGHGLRIGIYNAGTTEPADGVNVCLSPTLGPCTFDPVGVQITWATTANQLASPGVSYAININSGNVAFRGSADQRSILGTGRMTILPDPVDEGPYTNPPLDHAHSIGLPCPGTDFNQPLAGVLTVTGAGADIWQGGDQFLFAYRPVSGDFSARVTVTEREFYPGSQWGKHGIMARQDCSQRSRYSFIHDQQDPDATRMANRPTHGGADNFEITPAAVAPNIHANVLRLDRCGNEFIALVLDELGSFGGEPGQWVEVGRHEWAVDPPDTVQLGLAVTSHAGCNPTSITFEDYEVLTSCDAAVGDLSCTSAAGGGLSLTWSNPPGANPAEPIRILVDDVEKTTVPGTNTNASLPASALPVGVIATIKVINSSDIFSSCTYPAELSPQGFIQDWLLLGPLTQLGGAAPGAVEIAFDYLTDGAGITEGTIQPFAGQQINVDYFNPADGSGTANSTGLAPTPGRPDINPGGVPTWFAWSDPDDTIDYTDVFNADINDVMVYAAAYVTVPQDTTLDIGLGSDDAVQVLIDGIQVHLNDFARGYGVANEVQDTVVGVNLTAGCHLILVKVFEGGGGHGFRLRFQDSALPPNLAIPGRFGLACSEVIDGGFRRGDSDTSGEVNLTDAIRILNVLFLGIGAITCDDAADADDSGDVNLTDAIRVLNVLFLGIGSIGPPGVDNCGPDPTDDALGCASYPASC